MKLFWLNVFLIVALSCALFQNTVQAQEILDQPICFILKNEAPYGVFGEITTDKALAPNGELVQHRSTFRFDKKDSYDNDQNKPLDRMKVCSAGPFFPGQKLSITLRTLFPIFDCKTRIDRGEVIIKGFFKAEGGTETSVECY